MGQANRSRLQQEKYCEQKVAQPCSALFLSFKANVFYNVREIITTILKIISHTLEIVSQNFFWLLNIWLQE